ncbi:ABC transporter substrate-binding protein [Embleya sp. NPDC020886]|uniref:ABC transporter substrate-binding protein n=1 Tax=Embleya sp. NPDC020886 TaxID=3363980 RepID=UPI00379F948F
MTLVAAGCTIESKGPAGAPGAPAGPSVRAEAPGVTADSIKIGIAYPDFAAIKAFVNIDHGDFEATYRALIDKINADGGVQGRKLVPVFAKTNLISPAAAQETCVKLTQEEKVFAVLYAAPGNQQAACYLQNGRTAVIGGPMGAGMYAQARAPWFSFIGEDAAGRAVETFAARGDLAGRKVAVGGVVNDQAQIEQIVLPALKAAGVTPVATGYIAANASDPAAFAQQAGVLFQKAQTAGADTLLSVGAGAQLIPQYLEKTAWRPRQLFTALPDGYLTTKGEHDFSTLKDAVGATQVTDFADPALTACADTVTKADPTLTGKLVDPATVPSGRPTPGASMATACRTLALFAAITDKAGRNLDHATFQQAGFDLGTFHVPGFREPATYRRETPSGAIPIRAMVYDATANRFVPAAN